MRGGEAVGQPHDAKVRDRRNVDHHFRDHHEQGGEHQELAGKAKPPPRRGGAAGGDGVPCEGLSCALSAGALICVRLNWLRTMMLRSAAGKGPDREVAY